MPADSWHGIYSFKIVMWNTKDTFVRLEIKNTLMNSEWPI